MTKEGISVLSSRSASPEGPMPYQTIEVTKLTPHIGAEIGGVDLSRPLGNQQFQEVHDALMENEMVLPQPSSFSYGI
jgi:hypothetical protein